jgi:hypothetical protein
MAWFMPRIIYDTLRSDEYTYNYNFYIDKLFCSSYIANMKWQAIIILLAIALSIVVPSSLPFLSDQGAMAAIGTLDICHSSTPALSSTGDMPCISGSSCNPLPLALEDTIKIVPLLSKPYFIANQDERPPKS